MKKQAAVGGHPDAAANPAGSPATPHAAFMQRLGDAAAPTSLVTAHSQSRVGGAEQRLRAEAAYRVLEKRTVRTGAAGGVGRHRAVSARPARLQEQLKVAEDQYRHHVSMLGDVQVCICPVCVPVCVCAGVHEFVCPVCTCFDGGSSVSRISRAIPGRDAGLLLGGRPTLCGHTKLVKCLHAACVTWGNTIASLHASI